MTRINLIPAQQLHDKHLVAEYRELPRIFSLVKAAIARGETPDDARNPGNYVLGTGHVRFFYSRLGWLRMRFRQLVQEMQDRGFKTSYTDYDISDFPREWCHGYQPTRQDVALNKQRLKERGYDY